VTTILSGVLCALCAAVLPINVLSELTSVGTLFAFVLVCLGVLVLRYKQPDLPRRFKVPGGPIFVPLLGALTSGLLICTATVETLYRLVAWMAVGWLIYAFYGYKRSARELEQSQKPFPDSSVSARAKVGTETEEDINGALAAPNA
jgi:APA family basic amino acid/polyamine antiporter